MLRSLFVGSGRLDDAIGKVNETIKLYNSSLDDLGLLVMIETRNQGKMISAAVEETASGIQQLCQQLNALPSIYSIENLTEAHRTALR